MSSASATSLAGNDDQYSRTLDQFENRKELLYALHDAIAQNEYQWMTSGVAHGNISLDSIRIGNMRGPPGTRGVLVDNHSPRSTSPFAFRSVISTIRDLFGFSSAGSLDYVNDLESFYYVLAYICTTFSGPHARLTASNIPPCIKCVWSISEDGSLSREFSNSSFLEKKMHLRSFEHGLGSGCITPYFSSDDIIESLLKDFHCVVRYRHLRKVGGEGIDAIHASLKAEELKARLIEEADDDYFRFKSCIEYAIDLLDANDRRTVDPKIRYSKTEYKTV